jgi:hypothetical protein
MFDYMLPVYKIRKEFENWLQHVLLWKEQKVTMSIIHYDHKTTQLRRTMSVRNGGHAFDAACFIREKLITHIRENSPNIVSARQININASATIIVS